MQKHLRFLLLLMILLTSLPLFSQKNTTFINGIAKSLNNDVSNVLVVNLNSKRSTITDSLGLFIIEAKLHDTIRLKAVQFLTKDIIITDTIFLKKSVVINLFENVVSLNEVTVTPYNLSGKIDQDIKRLDIDPVVSASTLDLPNANLKVMTRNKRLLLVADRDKYTRFMTIEEKTKHVNLLGYLTIGAVINPDKIVSMVSGKTKTYKKMVEHDENARMEKRIVGLFSKETISEAFGIPQTNIDGFLEFCIAQKDFSELSDAKNTFQIWEYLKKKSAEYKDVND